MNNSLIAGFILLATSAFAQTAPTQPPSSFDVASVRPSRTDGPQHSNVPLDSGNVYSTISSDDARTAAGGLLIATHQPLWRYITFAYHLSGTQELALRFNYFSGLPKSGAPTWVTGTFNSGADYFDISARATPGTSIDRMRLMMQSLLADRFHLAVHHAIADAPVFALTLSKPGVPGPDLQPHPASDACTAAPQPEPTPTLAGLPPVCGVLARLPINPTPSNPMPQAIGGRAVSIKLFATSLPTQTGMAIISRPVVDRTGLTGIYDFTLRWARQSDPDDTAASFREALKSQLGMELKSTRAPIDILVVDHVEHPSAN